MGFGAKPSPYSPELAVSECSQLSEGLGAKLWCVKGITIINNKSLFTFVLLVRPIGDLPLMTVILYGVSLGNGIAFSKNIWYNFV